MGRRAHPAPCLRRPVTRSSTRTDFRKDNAEDHRVRRKRDNAEDLPPRTPRRSTYRSPQRRRRPSARRGGPRPAGTRSRGCLAPSRVSVCLLVPRPVLPRLELMQREIDPYGACMTQWRAVCRRCGGRSMKRRATSVSAASRLAGWAIQDSPSLPHEAHSHVVVTQEPLRRMGRRRSQAGHL